MAFIRARMLLKAMAGLKMEQRASGMLDLSINSLTEDVWSVMGCFLFDIPIFVSSVEFYSVKVSSSLELP